MSFPYSCSRDPKQFDGDSRMKLADKSINAKTELARVQVMVPVSVVIPTYKESENIPHILDRLQKLREKSCIDLEVLFMDDDSNDGSIEAVERFGADWARIVVRKKDRGLSAAVLDGFHLSNRPIIICMDCDLSHPPEAIPNLILSLQSGQQFSIGSRYVPGGSTDDDWGLIRWLNSRVATLLAWPLTRAKDPMSGFFAMRRSDFNQATYLNPVGYKIALELIVRCGLQNVGEVPIHFCDREFGQSKLSLSEQLKYLQHLRRLYIHKFSTAMHLLQFLIIGASGVLVNFLMLTLCFLATQSDHLSLAVGFGVSLISNFLLNRRFTFSYARDRNAWKQFFGFLTTSLIALVVSYSVAIVLRSSTFAGSMNGLYAASFGGIVLGTVFNFIGNRFVVFKKQVRNIV